jgi:hypothetical protein
MIELANGADVFRLLNQVCSHADHYADVVLCSPFIDDDVLPIVRRLAIAASAGGCGLKIITTQPAFDRVVRCIGRRPWQRTMVVSCPHLHAKFYLAVARKEAVTEAIVTSANLTAGGASSNIELGVRVAPTTVNGRALLRQIDRYARRLAINRSLSWKRH